MPLSNWDVRCSLTPGAGVGSDQRDCSAINSLRRDLQESVRPLKPIIRRRSRRRRVEAAGQSVCSRTERGACRSHRGERWRSMRALTSPPRHIGKELFACAVPLSGAVFSPRGETAAPFQSGFDRRWPLLVSSGASAQSTPSPSTSTQQEPAAGVNSFAEAQAQDRIEKAGFTEVKGLKKDGQGVWRGTAMQSGKQVSVGLDFKGNIVTSQ